MEILLIQFHLFLNTARRGQRPLKSTFSFPENVLTQNRITEVLIILISTIELFLTIFATEMLLLN